MYAETLSTRRKFLMTQGRKYMLVRQKQGKLYILDRSQHFQSSWACKVHQASNMTNLIKWSAHSNCDEPSIWTQQYNVGNEHRGPCQGALSFGISPVFARFAGLSMAPSSHLGNMWMSPRESWESMEKEPQQKDRIPRQGTSA